MGLRPRSDRGISTVIDVALALLFVSAAVMVLALYLDSDDTGHEPELADRTAETVAGTTVSAEYSLQSLEANDDTGAFDAEELPPDVTYDRVRHGPTAGVLADAAITNVHLDDDQLTHSGTVFEEAVDGATRNVLFEANSNAHVSAVWRPYESSSIEGQATTGPSPPTDRDVSSVTMTVPSGLSNVSTAAGQAYPDVPVWDSSEEYDAGDQVHTDGYVYEATSDTDGDPAVSSDWDQLRAHHGDGFTGTSHVIAAELVEGYVPQTASQHALEQEGLERALVTYHYLRFASVLDDHPDADISFDVDDRPLNRTHADAGAANEELTQALAAWIEDDLEDALESEITRIETEYSDPDEREKAIEAAITDAVSTAEVQITVRTWEP